MLTAPDPPVASVERIQMVLLYAIYQWVRFPLSWARHDIPDGGSTKNEAKIGESYYILCQLYFHLISSRFEENLKYNR